MSDDEWVSIEDPNKIKPISVYANAKDRAEFGGQPPKPSKNIYWNCKEQAWSERSE